MPQLIHAMLHPVDMKAKLLAVPLNLDRLTSTGREVELVDAEHLLLACYAAVDDEFYHLGTIAFTTAAHRNFTSSIIGALVDSR